MKPVWYKYLRVLLKFSIAESKLQVKNRDGFADVIEEVVKKEEHIILWVSRRQGQVIMMIKLENALKFVLICLLFLYLKLFMAPLLLYVLVRRHCLDGIYRAHCTHYSNWNLDHIGCFILQVILLTSFGQNSVGYPQYLY